MADRLQPFSSLPPDHLSGVRAVLFDVDGTLTTKGKLTSEAIQALEHAKARGLYLIAVTGAAAGTCDTLARMLPIDAVIGENGGFLFAYDPLQNAIRRRYVEDRETRRQNWTVYEQALGEIMTTVSGAGLASDQAFRECELAIDHGEYVTPPLDTARIDQIVTIMERHGMTATVSNVHVNGWIGAYDKLSSSLLTLRDLFGINPEEDAASVMVIGDSANDQALFDHFPLSVGVANVTEAGDRLITPPAYVTSAPFGAGFAEAVNALKALSDGAQDSPAAQTE